MRWSPVTYWWPGNDAAAWGSVLALTGPGSVTVLDDLDWPVPIAPGWKAGADATLAKGATPLVYVPTHKGMAGSPAEWGEGRQDAGKYSHEEILAQIRRAVDATGAQGVFLDEFSSLIGAHGARAAWYQELIRRIRVAYGRVFLIAGNPGVAIGDAAAALDVDVWLTFEDTAANYLAGDSMPEWLKETPAHKAIAHKLWHVVREVTPETLPRILDRARSLNVGHLYLTDKRLVPGADPLGVPAESPYAGPPSEWVLTMVRRYLEGVRMTGTISGEFKDGAGRPYEGWMVAKAPDGALTQINIHGGKVNASLPAGTYDLEAVLLGEGTAIWEDITVEDGKVVNLVQAYPRHRGLRLAVDSVLRVLKGGGHVAPDVPTPQPPTPGPQDDVLVPPVDPSWNNTAPYLAAFRTGEGKKSTMPILVIGDSWTGGQVTDNDDVDRTNQNRWEHQVQAAIGGTPLVKSQAISGQATGDYLLYTHALPIRVASIEGNEIPAQRNVEKRLTLKNEEAWFSEWAGKLGLAQMVRQANSYRTYWNFTLNGVAGALRMRWDDNAKKNYFTFFRSADGSVKATPAGDYELTATIGNDVKNGAQFIIELGINDAFQHYGDAQFAEKYLANVKAIIEKLGIGYQGAQPKHIAVMTIPPMSGEARDAARRKAIDKANAALVREFGPMVIDIASYLTSEKAITDGGASVTAGDREDLAKKSLPRSLMGNVYQQKGTFDATHMNSKGHTALSKFVTAELRRRGWVA